MPRSVIISTPIPTLEELGKSLGISKRRQAFLLSLVRGQKTKTADSAKVRRADSRPSKSKTAVARTPK